MKKNMGNYWYFPSNKYKSEADKKDPYAIDADETRFDIDEYSSYIPLELKDNRSRPKDRNRNKVEIGGIIEKRIRMPIKRQYREFIIANAKHRCSVCGKEEDLQIHHKDGNPANNRQDNLEVQCYSCHKKAHKAKRKIKR